MRRRVFSGINNDCLKDPTESVAFKQDSGSYQNHISRMHETDTAMTKECFKYRAKRSFEIVVKIAIWPISLLASALELYGSFAESILDWCKNFAFSVLTSALGIELGYIKKWFTLDVYMSLNDFTKAYGQIRGEQCCSESGATGAQNGVFRQFKTYKAIVKQYLKLIVKFPLEIATNFFAWAIVLAVFSPVLSFDFFTAVYIVWPVKVLIKGIVGGFITGISEAIRYFDVGSYKGILGFLFSSIWFFRGLIKSIGEQVLLEGVHDVLSDFNKSSQVFTIFSTFCDSVCKDINDIQKKIDMIKGSYSQGSDPRGFDPLL